VPFISLLEVGLDLENKMLFTTGMTLLDSVDSVLMLYSYTGFAEHRFRLFEPAWENDVPDHESSAYREAAATRVSAAQLPRSQGSHENETERCPLSAAPGEHSEQNGSSQRNMEQPVEVEVKDADAKIRDIRKEARRELIVKRNMMSGLSIVLTLMSIVVAFRCEFLADHGLLHVTSLCQHITNHDYGIDRRQLCHV
jgi:nickel/cobalt transporter (NiCoT) family protein